MPPPPPPPHLLFTQTILFAMCMSRQDYVTRFQHRLTIKERTCEVRGQISPRAAMIFKILQWRTVGTPSWKKGRIHLAVTACPLAPRAPLPPPQTSAPLPSASRKQDRSFRSRLRRRNQMYIGRRCVHGQKQQLEADPYIFFLIGRWLR